MIKSNHHQKIIKSNLLLVEGRDEVNFFECYLNFLKIDSIQIIEVKGKENFKREIPKLKVLPGFSDVMKIGIIRDADTDFVATFRSIYDRLKENGFNPVKECNIFSESHPSIGIFIMPSSNQNGSLEDLCLEAINNDEIMKCSYQFIDCLKSFNPNIKNESKRLIQTYLASKDELCSNIGLGAMKKYWNFDSVYYNDLKNFIKELS